ncbi:MAG: IS3 family transposase [Solirubrobacteraceae bacterium]
MEGPGPERVPDPELVEQAKRRSFTAQYKARILAEADACVRPGEVGELLRREGLYTSHLTYWRKQRKDGALRELGQPRGRKPVDRRDAQIAALTRRAERAEAELAKMQRVVGDPGKRLSAVGRDARSGQRAEEHRAMIERTVEEMAPLIGTRAACRALGASSATIYRRRRPPEPRPRRRPRPTPARALTSPERAQVLDVLHSERFVDISPEETWATLLDEGRYLCSTRTMYRILAAHHGGVRERRDQLTHPVYARPELLAQRPNELWSWDVSKLKAPTRGTWFFLYVILDVFSRYIVGWTVQSRETGELATALIEQAIGQQPITPSVLHADRGAPMRSKHLSELLDDLGVAKTHSRPYTSSDNPYSEANFKTLKYRPAFPARFDSIEHAREHCRAFVDWYNHAHRHSGIGLMTPAAVHHGNAQQLRDARARVLDAAYQRHPERFVRKPPAPPELPTAAWINKPADTNEVAH